MSSPAFLISAVSRNQLYLPIATDDASNSPPVVNHITPPSIRRTHSFLSCSAHAACTTSLINTSPLALLHLRYDLRDRHPLNLVSLHGTCWFTDCRSC